MNKKKLVYDVVLSIAANAIPFLILQFIILPIINRQLGNNVFGLMIVLTSLINFSSGSFGGVLNNSRLLLEEKYRERNFKGDFNLLLRASLIINSIIVFCGSYYFRRDFNIVSICMIVVISMLSILSNYLSVEFRIKLNYTNIMLSNVSLCIGYLLGLVLFYLVGYWELIYLCGYLFNVGYIFANTRLWKEPLLKTEFFRFTIKKCIILFVAVILANTIVYIDRFLLYPLLGAEMVSIYYVSTLLGKSISLVITPINGVILSYLAKIKKVKNNSFFALFIGALITGVLGYIFCILISRTFLNILYPNVANEAMKYIFITTASAIILLLCEVVNPFLLRYCDLNLQIAINSINVVLYSVCSLTMSIYFGLMGFCIGVLFASFLKLCIMIIIYYISNKRMDTNIKGEGKNETEFVTENKK